jgi:hypothetical protein
MKTKHFLVADTETTGLGNKAIVFDFGYTIATRKAIKLERSFLVREVITNPRIMLGALFNDDWRAMFGGKIFRHYIPELNSQHIALHSWTDIVETLRDDMHTFGVDVFSAFNLRFDMGAMATTQQHIKSGGKVLDYRPDLLDLWNFASEVICTRPTYHAMARKHGQETGFITPANNVRTNAEKVYAYLTQNPDFIESHTALHDAQIETEILQRLLATKKKIPYNELPYMPWKKAQILVGQKSLI